MEIERIRKESFAVVGLEGSTEDGDDFVQVLWETANARFGEVEHLALRDDNGCPVGFWGAMTDFSRSFMPWEDGFSKGLYLAGVECGIGANEPPGWSKWIVPSFEFLRVECNCENVFARMLEYIAENGLELAGAVQDFTCPATGRNYMLFPIRRI